MPRFLVKISTGLIGCVREATVEISEDELDGLEDGEREDCIQESILDFIVERILSWSYSEVL